jgi:hypothetical protein
MTENNRTDVGRQATPVESAKATEENSAGTARTNVSTGNGSAVGTTQKIKGRKVRQNSKSKKTMGGANQNSTVQRRKRFTIGLIVLIVIVDLVVGTVVLSQYFFKPKADTNPDPIALIQQQLPVENIIPEIGYDSSLTFANHTNLTIANTASMKPIENNLFKKGAGTDGSDLLYDALTVNRVLRLNTDWIEYLNQGNQRVFDSLATDPKYPAKTKLLALGGESQIAYHRIALGEIRHIGSKYYILAQASYILVHNGQHESFNDLFVYEIIAQGNTLVVSDFERIPQNQAQGNQVPEENRPAADETGEGTPPEGETEGTFEEDTQEQTSDTTAEEPEPQPEESQSGQ